VPLTLPVQNMPAVPANLVFYGIDSKPSIGLANAYKRPFSLFTGIDNNRAQIKSIEQHCNLELVGNIRFADDFRSQFSELFERDVYVFGMFFFNIEPGAKGYRYTSVEKTGLETCMPVTIFAGGVVINFSDRLHFLGQLYGLGVIDNEQAIAASFFVKFFEHCHCLRSNDGPLVEGISPEELTVVCPVRAVTKEIYKPLYGAGVTDADSHDKVGVIAINMSRNIVFERPEKRLDFFLGFCRL
jgi:hypothetical protein